MTDLIRTVLVPTDLQATSRSVVEMAGHIARAADARLVLLHVIEPAGQGYLPRRVRDEGVEARAGEVTRALELQVDELESAGTRVESRQLVGASAHRTILEQVEETGADIVVLGSHAREGRGHRLGSTADRLLRSSPVPCLVVRGRVRTPASRIGLLTDFSRHARRAGKVTADWLEILGGEEARLDVIHAANRYYLDLDASLEGLLTEKLEKEVSATRERVERFPVDSRLYGGEHPVDVIVEAAEREEYDLLVMGTHGHGPVRRALVGSIAMGLAQSAPCPVLVVPAPSGG